MNDLQKLFLKPALIRIIGFHQPLELLRIERIVSIPFIVVLIGKY